MLLLDNLEAYGIRDNALNLGEQSGLRAISCGIPHCSILGQLFSLAYINDLPNCLKHTTPRRFADDTSLTAYGKSIEDLIY